MLTVMTMAAQSKKKQPRLFLSACLSAQTLPTFPTFPRIPSVLSTIREQVWTWEWILKPAGRTLDWAARWIVVIEIKEEATSHSDADLSHRCSASWDSWGSQWSVVFAGDLLGVAQMWHVLIIIIITLFIRLGENRSLTDFSPVWV